jgi:glycosyltransferase involved in cell wall biosynthesis
MIKPTFSVVTVCYNAELFLEKTLKSVFDQSCQDFEYLIIDGESTDGTMDIVGKYRGRFSVVVSEPDAGLYDAMNKAIELVSGSFVLFLNAGDYFADNSILEQVKACADENECASLIYGDYIVYRDSHEKRINCQKAVVSIKRDFYFCHQAIFFGKTHLQKFDLRYQIKADYDLVIRQINAAGEGSAVYCPFPIVKYALEGFSNAFFWLNLRETVILHYRKWGLLRVLCNTPIYLKRYLRSLKENFIK